MKKDFLKIIIAGLFSVSTLVGTSQLKKNVELKNITENGNNFSVSILGNGYAYPKSGDESEEYISKDGISGWSDATTYFKVFFWPQENGKINVSLKLKADAENKLSVQLDGSAKSYDIIAKKSNDFIVQPVGDFSVTDDRYHFIQIKGISKSGKNFPDIEAVIISGPAAKDLKYNLSEYKGAASTHIWYAYPKDSAVAWFYNEVTVPEEANAVNAYYMTNGFSGGYAGIQLNSLTERRFIFSIWSNYNTNNPKEIPADYAVKLIKKGKDVVADDFGNEGSGGHSHLVFNWKNGNTYKILIGAKPAGDHTIYTAYYFTPENNDWRLIAQWDKTKTNGSYLSGLYSFVENFGPNGNDFFKADYGNQWICTPSGTWIEMTKCTLTTTASASKHQRYDYGAGVEDNKFYMFTGGFKKLNNMQPHTSTERQPNGIPPAIDFSKLPSE